MSPMTSAAKRPGAGRVSAALLVMFALVAAGCSGEDEGNVFEAQTQAIDKAEEANRMLEEAAAKQRQAIDEQGR